MYRYEDKKVVYEVEHQKVIDIMRDNSIGYNGILTKLVVQHCCDKGEFVGIRVYADIAIPVSNSYSKQKIDSGTIWAFADDPNSGLNIIEELQVYKALAILNTLKILYPANMDSIVANCNN